MTRNLLSVQSTGDIPPRYRDTPVGRLLRYHNLNASLDTYTRADLLIGMCMDHRKHLRIPNNFAYIIRSGGANLRYSEFTVSYAISVGGVRAIALIGHNDCGMVNLAARKDTFIRNLVASEGWSREQAEAHFYSLAPLFEIGNEVDFVSSEVTRLRDRYPNVIIAPLIYRVEDNRLYLVDEG